MIDKSGIAAQKLLELLSKKQELKVDEKKEDVSRNIKKYLLDGIPCFSFDEDFTKFGLTII